MFGYRKNKQSPQSSTREIRSMYENWLTLGVLFYASVR